MSCNPTFDPGYNDDVGVDAIETLIIPRASDPGGFEVNRVPPGPRCIWWNFGASSRERIEEAKAEWRAERLGTGRFDLPDGNRDEHLPLPG